MYASEQYREVADVVECVNGTAITDSDTFRCNNVSNVHPLCCMITHLSRLIFTTSYPTPLLEALVGLVPLHGVSVYKLCTEDVQP